MHTTNIPSFPSHLHTYTHTSSHAHTKMCADPLAQLYLPQGQYVDYVRVADYCTVTVKETNVFHRQASISARGLLATDYSSKWLRCIQLWQTKERGQEEEEGGERIKRKEWLHKWGAGRTKKVRGVPDGEEENRWIKDEIKKGGMDKGRRLRRWIRSNSLGFVLKLWNALPLQRYNGG